VGALKADRVIAPWLLASQPVPALPERTQWLMAAMVRFEPATEAAVVHAPRADGKCRVG
jgi:hypothetical protein